MLGTAALRIALAAGTGLGIDESYMVAAGRTLQLSYFDHPGMAWWLSRLAALAAGSEAPLVVRVPFIALFAASTWLMFLLTRRLSGERSAFWAVLGFNLSPVFSVTTATWVLPDGPLSCALLASAYCLVRGVEARSSYLWWSLAGLFAGLAMLSKYSAVLVLVGAFLYLLTCRAHRHWLLRPHPYVAVLIAACCCAPILIWNVRNGFASFAFQGGRAETVALHPFGPLVTLAGEALFVGPWIWLPLMFAWIAAIRNGPGMWRSWLPACLGAVPVVLFVVVSLWGRHVLFHWAAPGYLMLFPLLGAWAERTNRLRPKLLRIGTRASAALLTAGILILLIEARVNLLAPFGTDPGLQATDWTPLGQQLAVRGLLVRADTAIGATNWAETGKLDYGLGGAVTVICLNPDARQYKFLPGTAPRRGQNIVLVGVGLSPERLQAYRPLFDSIDILPPLRLRETPVGLVLARGFK